MDKFMINIVIRNINMARPQSPTIDENQDSTLILRYGTTSQENIDRQGSVNIISTQAPVIKPITTTIDYINSFSLRPDVPDYRDILFNKGFGNKPLPKSVDLRPYCTAIEDQGSTGSCTAHALTGAIELLINILKNRPGSAGVDLSRAFLYYVTRLSEGIFPSDKGVLSMRDVIKSCLLFTSTGFNKTGIPDEAAWGWLPKTVNSAPNDVVYSVKPRKFISEYLKCPDSNSAKTALALRYPIFASIKIYNKSGTSNDWNTNVKSPIYGIKIPGPKDTFVGMHAICIVGYDDSIKSFIIRNSWGPNWGNRGYATLPYEFYDSFFMGDKWAITNIAQE
jgi:C1A family cysteine protease